MLGIDHQHGTCSNIEPGTDPGLLRLSKIDVLVVDDWAMTPLSENEARDF